MALAKPKVSAWAYGILTTALNSCEMNEIKFLAV